MPSVVHLAELSSAIYEDPPEVGIDTHNACELWTRPTPSHRTRFGYLAAVFQLSREERAIVFCGSDDAFDFLVDDANILAGSPPPQLSDAVKSVAQWATPKTILTGHSLGGALAILAAAKFNLPAVSFNAPRVLAECLQVAFQTASPTMAGRCVSSQKIINIRVGGDPVSSILTTGLQTGATRKVSGRECGINLLCRHSMKTVLDEVRTERANFDPIAL